MYKNNNPKQPDLLSEILALRPEGADTAAKTPDNLRNRMKGALIAIRINIMNACCTLVTSVVKRVTRLDVENLSILAKENSCTL